MEVFKSKIFYYLISIFIVFIFIIPWVYPYEKMELGTYNAYTESLITDGDLNIINQMPVKTSWYVTPTYNYPDILSSGTAIIWSPFFYYAHVLEELNLKANLFGYSSLDISQLILSITFSIFIFLYMHKNWIEKFGVGNFYFNSIGLFFGTGFFFYFIAIPTNNDITLALIVAFAFEYFYRILHGRRFESDWFLLGLLIGFILNFKTIGAIYSLPIFVSILIRHDEIKKKIFNLVRFSLGLFLTGSAYLINSYIQRGVLFEPRVAAMTGDFFKNNFYEIALGGRGFVFISPVYIISILYIAFEIYSWIRYKKINSKLAFFIFIFCWMKVFLLSFRFFSNEFFGARTLISDFYLICIAYMSVFKQTNGVVKRILILSVSVAAFITAINSIIKISTDKYVFEITSNDFQTINLYFEKFRMVIFSVCTWSKMPVLFLFLPLIILLSYFMTKYFRKKTELREDINSEQKMIFLLVVSLFVVTTLNAINNQRNVKQLKAEGYFNDRAVVKGPLSFGYEGFISELNLEILIAKLKNDKAKLNYFSLLKEKYIKSIQQEIITDPLKKFQRSGDNAVSVFDLADTEDPNNAGVIQEHLINNCLRN